MKNILLFSLALFLATGCLQNKKQDINNQALQNVDKMQWWKDAKFGMFIHWGVYSVPAGTYHGEKIGSIGEWIMNNAEIPVEEYKAYANEFNPVKYDPEEWVKLAKEAGMKYIVITSKHHDGFALFDSKVTDWDIADASPYGKDLLKPLVEACHKYGIRIGFYYSQAQDWNHPGGGMYREKWDSLQNGSFEKYIDSIAIPQVEEILSKYGDIDILWWDTPANMTKELAQKFDSVISKYPNLITNSRLGGGYDGDLQTPEQTVPPTALGNINWETCMTMNDTWGYKSYDDNWKSPSTLIRTLISIVSKGGNFLLNVGPTSEGLIPQASVDRLKQIGEWVQPNQEAIYGTKASPFHYLSWGSATYKGSRVYLFVEKWPADGRLVIPVLNQINKASLLSNPEIVYEVVKVDNKQIVQLPKQAPDTIATVIALDLDSEPEVLPIPSLNKKSVASSDKGEFVSANLFDQDNTNKWEPQDSDTERWVEVVLEEDTPIQAFAVIEPWHVWDNKGQKLALQYKKGDIWETAIEIKTGGVGISQAIEPVTARFFRIKILESKDPALNEWMLFRAD